MAIVTFSADPPPIDDPLEKLVKLADGRPVKLRLQPDIYNHDSNRYDSWSGLIWTIEIGVLEDGRRLREGLTDFLRLFGNPVAQAQILNVLRSAVEVFEKAPVGTVRADVFKDQIGE